MEEKARDIAWDDASEKVCADAFFELKPEIANEYKHNLGTIYYNISEAEFTHDIHAPNIQRG